RQRSWFFFILVLTVAAGLVSALQPWPMAVLADQVLGRKPLPHFLQAAFDALGFQPSPTRLLILAALGGLVLFALNSALEIGLTSGWTLAGRRMVYNLAADLYARLQRRSLPFHSRNSVGDTMSRITGDSWCVYQVLDALCFGPFHAVLNMAAVIFLMAQLD